MVQPRNRPIVAVRALMALAKDPNDLPKVFELIDSLPGRSPARVLAQMRQNADGRRLLATRPDLPVRLDDRAALMALPTGTLGRSYAEAADGAGITAQGIVSASEAGMTRAQDLPDDLRFSGDRLRDTHDLWHVVTGYGFDVLGELALLSFLYAQTRQPGVGLICSFAFLHFVPSVNALMRAGYRRGKEAVWLPAVVWEDLLACPLDEVRARLRVGDPPAYTPITTASLRASGIIPTNA